MRSMMSDWIGALVLWFVCQIIRLRLQNWDDLGGSQKRKAGDVEEDESLEGADEVEEEDGYEVEFQAKQVKKG